MLITVAILAALLLVAALYLYTPDKPRAALEAHYAPSPSQFVPILGNRLHIRDTGAPASARPDAPALILLHGFGNSLQTWDAWSDALSPQYRMVRLDLPGFALSGPDPSGDYSDARAIAVIEGLMDRLGISKAILVGNSMGGNIAWRFAAAHPGRVDRLVLIAPAGFRPPGAGTRPARLPVMFRLMKHVLPMPLLRMNMQASYADPAKLTPPLMRRYRDMILVPGIRQAILDRMLQTTWPDPIPLLRTIQAPTLLLWGERDRLIPLATAQDYLAALPHAELVVLPGQGHAPQEEAPLISLAPVRAFIAR